MSFLEDNGYLIFDGVKSSDYGVWINGRETFNAPARRYKEYVIPGRNGVLTIDEGAFEEQEVTYPAFIVNNFSANVQAFRNALMARNGYVRLTDSYHPDEFYLAKYMSGLEADVTPWGRAGKFDLTFKRDPRRFLLSGETPVTYPPGATAKNLLVYPYYTSTITRNGVTLTDNGDGSVTLNGTATAYTNFVLKQYSGAPQLTEGASYYLSGCPTGGSNRTYCLIADGVGGSIGASVREYGSGVEFTYTGSVGCYVAITVYAGATLNNVTFKPWLVPVADKNAPWEPYYDGATHIYNPTLFASNPLIRVTGAGTVGIGDNTITVGSGYAYVDIDSEIQNCYCGTQNANAIVSFSTGEFPTLPPGVTGITVGSGITSVQITPRWYRV